MAVAFSYDVSTNTVTVTGGTSGSPADFAQFVTKDRATAASLLAAWAPNSNTKTLTYQVRPVESLALLISFAVASKTTETDYIFITGTDWLGAAQTEAINVSAGNGTYVTTKYFRTVTNIDCSDSATSGGMVWANGTVTVTQPIWGVIWDKGNEQYQLDSLMVFGNGSTSTYFTDINKQITISAFFATWSCLFKTTAGATVTFGKIINATDKTTKCGCSFIVNGTSNYFNNYLFYNVYGGLIYLYSVQILGCTLGDGRLYVDRMWNCSISSDRTDSLYGLYTLPDLINTTFCQANWIIQYPGTVLQPIFEDSNVCFYGWPIMTLNKPAFLGTCCVVGQDISINDKYLIDAGGVFTVTWSGSNSKRIYEQYTFNLHLVDISGVNIAGATVTLKDNTASTVFSVSTGTDGKIVQQTVSRGYYDQAHSGTRQEYSPFTLTITKTGYQDYTDIITIDRKMDLEVALLVLAGGAVPTYMGLVPLGIKQAVV